MKNHVGLEPAPTSKHANPPALTTTSWTSTVWLMWHIVCNQSHNVNGQLQSMHIVESSACSRGFANEDELHFFFGCPLFNRPRIILQNVISSVAPFAL